jgi:drug/metabolite transporter (DMT)-like permease
MSAIDHAAVRVPVEPVAARRPWPAASRAALAFVAMQIPLTLIALAFEWRGTWGAPEEQGPLLADFLRYGSGVSGPLAPQLILLVLAFGARREGRLGRVAGAGIGVMGVLIAFNGAMAGFSEAVDTPRGALVVAALFFTAAGFALVVAGVRRVVERQQ